MGEGVNTNIEALHKIKNSLVRFQERITPLQGELMQAFQEIDEQLADGIKRKLHQIEERKRKENEENRTDSFACDSCKGRIHLKIMGDTTHCREVGCNGTLHRVYTDRHYSSAQPNNDKEELEQIRQVVNNYNRQKADFLQLFSSFFSSEAADVNRGVTSLTSCISILEQYLGTDISIDADFDQEEIKKLKASATNSLERAENRVLEVPLMSDLSDAFISKLPQKRRSAVHTAYAKTPDYIIVAINQRSNQLNYVRNTEYEQDQFGHFILDEHGNRMKENCYYSQDKKYIAMHDEMSDEEYADVIQHELGHFIDDVLGRPSTKATFSQAFSDTASRYNADTLEGRRLLIDMLDDAFSTGAAHDRNVTDIISALTLNNPIVADRFDNEDISYYHHNNIYWNQRNADGTNAKMREKDSFANVFAIEAANYRISTNFVERWFPELPVALRQSVGGAK